MTNKFLRLKYLLPVAFVAVSACSSLPDWLGSADKKKLSGDRFSVLQDDIKITPDTTLASETIDIPDEITTSSNGSNTGNYHLDGDLSQVTKISGGDGPDGDFLLYYPPLVAEGTVYVIDGHSNVNAYDADTLKEKWHHKSDASKKDRDLPGGGLAYAYGVLYASTGYGDVVAITAADGKGVWHKNLGAPLRRPPVVQEDKVFAVTIENQLFALSVVDGSTLWRHSGVKENTSFYGSANPVVKNDVLVVAYSSGEVFGISTTRGNELWTELIALGSDMRSALSSLNDVSAAPIIVDGIVYIAGHSGDLAAFNSVNGFKIWSQKLGPIETTPWTAGHYIYVIVQNNKLVALNRFDGRVKWVTDLPKQKDKHEKNFWSGPVMAGGKLVITASDGKLITLDALNGNLLKTVKIPPTIFVAPVVANGKLFMLTRDADLVQVK